MPKILEIVEWPSEVLETRCLPADLEDPSLKELAENMVETLANTKIGVGISANQVGKPVRMIVVHINDAPTVMVNPEIVKTSKGMGKPFMEGCLSFPGMELEIRRRAWCAVEFYDLEGTKHRRKLFGIEAICVQHEIDHLDGKVFIDLAPGVREFLEDAVEKGKAELEKNALEVPE